MVTIESLGEEHACALDATGAPICWLASPLPGPPAPLHVLRAPALRFVQIASNSEVTCGVSASGKVACWEPRARKLEVKRVPERLGSIAVFNAQVCGVTPDDGVKCWRIEHLQ